MGKKTIIYFSKIFLLLISSILLAYLLLIENGVNPKINHLLNKNNYFWIIVIITAIILAILTFIVSVYVFQPCIIQPTFDYINSI